MNVHEEFNRLAKQIKKRNMLDEAYKRVKSMSGYLYIMDIAPTKPHHAIVTAEEDEYLVSVLKQPTQNKDSYVEVMVTKNHPLYPRFNDAVAVLNVAGTQTQVEGVGEAFQTGIYHVVLTQEEHKLLAGV
jgi:hypothetical protein